jgi:hypothetical protein
VFGISLADRLRDRLEGIFRRNEITPNTAAAEIEEINSRIQSVSASIDSLNSALEALGIGAEDLAPGEFEVGFLIPREAVDNELEQLGKEFEELDAILGPFMELTGQGRPDLQVRSISSSGFQLFLAALPDRALTMSKIVESLLSSYERIKRLREKAAGLEDEEVPDELIERLKIHANERMEIDINALTNELVGKPQRAFQRDGRMNCGSRSSALFGGWRTESTRATASRCVHFRRLRTRMRKLPRE